MTVSLKFTFKVMTLSLRIIEKNADRDPKVDYDFLYIVVVNLTYLRNLLPNSDFKLVQTPYFLCKHKTNAGSFRSPITSRTCKILVNTTCRADNCIYITRCKVFSKQYIKNTVDNWRSNIMTKKFKELVEEHFNLSGNKWEDIKVVTINHNPHWMDAETKSKKNFWMPDSNLSDLMAWASRLTSLRWTSHSFITCF